MMFLEQVCMTVLPNFPLIYEQDDLSQIILNSCQEANIHLQTHDVLVVAQKIVSKAEGRLVDLTKIQPSEKAIQMGQYCNKKSQLIELILQESKEILRFTKGSEVNNMTGHIIVRHNLNHILANAGIDQSNISHEDKPDGKALLLPKDPDKSCAKLRQDIFDKTGALIGVVMNDSMGRPWRNGTVGFAIGLAGLPAVLDLRGQPDLFGRKLKTSISALADEIAAAASLLMGQAAESRPVIHFRGLKLPQVQGTVQDLIRDKDKDLFL